MEMSDTLFGVTMEDQGVSKLVSVNLKRIEEQKAA
jgi:chromosome segregation ATPase